MGGPTMLAVAVPPEDAFATLVALMVTLAGLGGVAGAANRPVAEMIPTTAFPPAIPLTLHVTAVFAEPVTVALNWLVPDGATVTVAGETVTVTGGPAGACTVTLATPLADASAALVARTVTTAGLGTAAGAV